MPPTPFVVLFLLHVTVLVRISIISYITLNVDNQRAVIVCSIAEVDTSILKSQVYEYKLCLKGINWYLVAQLTVRDSLTVDVIPVWYLRVQVASVAHILTESSKYNLAKTIGEGGVCKIEGYERDKN